MSLINIVHQITASFHSNIASPKTVFYIWAQYGIVLSFSSNETACHMSLCPLPSTFVKADDLSGPKEASKMHRIMQSRSSPKRRKMLELDFICTMYKYSILYNNRLNYCI